MNFGGGERTLEKYKAFPYIAWTLVFGFSIFIYNLTLELRSVAENLKVSTSDLQNISEYTSSTKTTSSIE